MMKLPMAAFLAHQLPTVSLDHHQKLFYFDWHGWIISQPILSLHNVKMTEPPTQAAKPPPAVVGPRRLTSYVTPSFLRQALQHGFQTVNRWSSGYYSRRSGPRVFVRGNLSLINDKPSHGDIYNFKIFFHKLRFPRETGYAGILNASPRCSMAQHMRAFLAAMATTAFQ